MRLKGIIYNDIVNYKRCSLTLQTCFCTFKCEKECGKQVCQNNPLIKEPIVEIDDNKLIERYTNDTSMSSIIFQGLEPFDQFDELFEFIRKFREKSSDDLVIYSGYNKSEIEEQVNLLKQFPNIIVKFGRYIPNDTSRYDEILGITLASSNQYAEKIS